VKIWGVLFQAIGSKKCGLRLPLLVHPLVEFSEGDLHFEVFSTIPHPPLR